MTEAARLEKLIEKYKFTVPIPDPARVRCIESQERVLRSALKEVGVYSVWFAAVITILFKLRSLGMKSTIVAAKAATIVTSALLAGVIAGGTYATIKYVYPLVAVEKSEVKTGENAGVIQEKIPAVDSNIQQQEEEKIREQNSGPVSEIRLYNGRVYRGVVLSRGRSYIIETSNGKITVPAKQIRIIKRVK